MPRNLSSRRHACKTAAFVAALAAVAMTTAAPAPKKTTAKRPALYLVGYSHLDTEWCWSYPQVIREFIPKTLHDNFALFEKYPDYIFNWTGSNRYRFMKEYYPEDFEKLKKYIAAGRWVTAGSSVEEGDVNMPSEESLIRQVMYGNEFFKKEFGTGSDEYMLPDCFGFPASLPSILAFCGLKGFSTQKLTWGSAVGIPFNVGVWQGPDGESIVSALNPDSYGSEIRGDQSNSQYWANRLAEDQIKDGVAVDYHYYGTGDTGGSPDEQSVKAVEQSLHGGGPVNVVAGRADQLFRDLSPDDIAKLPTYKGDLELTQHSAGSLTSEAAMKRWNRKNELLGDATERAAVAADMLGTLPYDKDRITDAWLRFLPGQFHDLMAGTALPQAYNFAWNDQVIAMNEFAGQLQASVGAVAKNIDTQTDGVPLVVYNPLSIDRTDPVEVTVHFPDRTPTSVHVLGPNGHEVPSQILSRHGNDFHLVFQAYASSIGFSTFTVEAGESKIEPSQDLHVDNHSLENAMYRVEIDSNGDVSSVFDKTANREMLQSPLRLAYQHENPQDWPAWNMDWKDQSAPPRAYVGGPAEVKVVEDGPVRVALQITRQSEGSTFVQTLRLSRGNSGARLEFVTKIDWQGKESALMATFPLTVANPMATYNWGLGTIQRGNDDPKKYEVPSHMWIDLTNQDGSYGASILDDCKYGSDKPNDNTLRLTLLYTPGTHGGYQHQGTQDWGQNEMTYALVGHRNDWVGGDTQWQAARLNQPMLAFQTSRHEGALGKSFSLASVSDRSVSIEALKQAEDGDEVIVRLNELSGKSVGGVKVKFSVPIVSAREVDGQEREIGGGKVEDGQLVVDMAPYRPRAFAVRLAHADQLTANLGSHPIDLPFNTDAASSWANKKDGNFDGHGNTLPGELLPSTIVSDGIQFNLGSTSDGQQNAVACQGQKLDLPEGSHRWVYLLAASTRGDRGATFKAGEQKVGMQIQNWEGMIGQWDTRIWGGQVPEEAYDWHNPLVGLEPGFIKRQPVAWYADHRRLSNGQNDLYHFCYLFRYGFAIPDGERTLTLPNDPNIKVFAVSVSEKSFDDAAPAQPLYDTLERSRTAGPTIEPTSGTYSDSQTVQIGHPFYWSPENPVRYTTDGTDPNILSPEVTGPIYLTKSTALKVAQFENGHVVHLAAARYTINDRTAPTLLEAKGMANARTIQVVFSKPVTKATAEDASHYSVGGRSSIVSAKLGSDNRTVMLLLATNLAPGQQLTVRSKGVADTSPNANATNNASTDVTLLQPSYTLPNIETAAGTGAGFRAGNLKQLPTAADAKWTINAFVYMDKEPGDLSLIAGFGNGRDQAGAQRYIIKNQGHIYFWGSNIDIDSFESFDIGRWQMITVTYDGTNVRIYKNGKEIKTDQAQFQEASAQVRIGPPPAWSYGNRFAGKVACLTIWNDALSPDYVHALLSTGPKS